MPHSLRVKIKGLRYKGIITDKDCDRLCKALDNEDLLDKIRDEIEESITDYILDEEDTNTARRMGDVMTRVFEIIDKYNAESEDKE